MPFLNDYPEWATSNPTDPTSGQPAIIEPSSGKKASGFTRLERPPRQDFNWLFNQSGSFLSKLSTIFNGSIDGFRLIEMPLPVGNVRLSQGRCLSTDNTFLFDTGIDTNPWPGTGLLKDLTSTFAAGNNTGGRSSSVALADNTHYHVFVIRLSNGDIDVGFDNDVQAANLITDHGITNFRRIMTVHWVNAGFGYTRLRQYGDYFMYDRAFQPGPVITCSGAGTFFPVANGFALPGISTLLDIRFVADWTANPKNINYITVTGDLASAQVVTSTTFDMNVAIFDANEITQSITKRIIQDGNNNNINVQTPAGGPGGSFDVRTSLIGYWDTRGRDWGSGAGASDHRGLFFG